MTLLENEPVRATPSPTTLLRHPLRPLFALYTGCGGNRTVPSSREKRVSKEREMEGGRESVDTRFQGYGMVASSCFFPLVSFCSSFCFCFLTFFLRDAGNLRLKLDRVGLIARARGELLVARISRGRMVKIVLRVISWSN